MAGISGPTGPTGSYGVSGVAWGVTGMTGSVGSTLETLSNDYGDKISYDSSYYLEAGKSRFTIEGTIKKTSLLILRKALRLKELNSYNIEWGPFVFDTNNNFEPQLSQGRKHSKGDLKIILEIMEEFDKLITAKVLW